MSYYDDDDDLLEGVLLLAVLLVIGIWALFSPEFRRELRDHREDIMRAMTTDE